MATVRFEVNCANCGHILGAAMRQFKDCEPVLFVTPCERCCVIKETPPC